jgi:hypothetical protein
MFCERSIALKSPGPCKQKGCSALRLSPRRGDNEEEWRREGSRQVEHEGRGKMIVIVKAFPGVPVLLQLGDPCIVHCIDKEEENPPLCVVVFFIYFILFLNYHQLIIWGDFIVITSYMHGVYFEHVYFLHYISIPLFYLSSCQSLVGFIMLSSYVYR